MKEHIVYGTYTISCKKFKKFGHLHHSARTNAPTNSVFGSMMTCSLADVMLADKTAHTRGPGQHVHATKYVRTYVLEYVLEYVHVHGQIVGGRSCRKEDGSSRRVVLTHRTVRGRMVKREKMSPIIATTKRSPAASWFETAAMWWIARTHPP